MFIQISKLSSKIQFTNLKENWFKPRVGGSTRSSLDSICTSNRALIQSRIAQSDLHPNQPPIWEFPFKLEIDSLEALKLRFEIWVRELEWE
jgi:hypothetical protein